MVYIVCLALFFPLISFLGLTAGAKILHRRLTSLIACSTVLVSFACFVTLLFLHASQNFDSTTFVLYKWIPIADIDADFTLHIDTLSILMGLIITGIGFLIHVYSIGYMDHEMDFTRYFACMNFFIFSMLLLVLAGHLLVLFIGWEGVGLASYLLIGFWYDRPSAAKAATKAFVMNRIGDLGLLIGLLLTFYLFKTGNITEILHRAGQEFSIGAPLVVLLTLLYFIGATGKSAQIPLYTWLPDAMEGPTPVSALIHAATMVTAGVYLVVRMHPVFLLAPETLHVIGIIGAVTSLFAALCAVGQTDLKRVLAYSTISQLGLMFLACGAGAFYAAMFHLTTHAFMKSLLFLSAGNVVHMMHGTTEMEKMGGLSKIFTKTHWLFLVGVLAMSGLPPFAAFFSKDLILEQEHHAGFDTLFYIGLVTSILTAFYLIRAYCLTFAGPLTLDKERLKGVKEAPLVMLIPVAILALLSIFGGFLGFSFSNSSVLESFLSKSDLAIGGNANVLTFVTWLSIIGAFLGVSTAVLLYTRFISWLKPTMKVLKRSFYIDELYDRAIVKPLEAFARFIANVLEPKFFDRTILLLTQSTRSISQKLQKMQSGQIRSYVAWMTLGAAVLIVYCVL